MPIGGRINRRDNLRSKKALTKTKALDKDNNVKQSNTKNSSVLLNITKTKSSPTKLVADTNLDKSEVISKGFPNFYVYLEDIKFNDQESVIDKSNSDKDNLNSRKNKITLNIESQQKNDKTEIVTENLYDTLKRKGRHTKKNDTDLLKTSIVEKVAKIETSENKMDTLKRRGRKKKENVGIPVNVESLEVPKSVSEVSPDSLPIRKTKIPSLKDGELNASDKLEIERKIETIKESPIKKTKLGRKNAFQKVREQNLHVQLVVEKMEIDDQNISEDEKKSDMNVVEVDLDDDNVDNKSRVRGSINAKLIDDKNDMIVEEVEQSKSTIQRTRSRLTKSKKQFVTEKGQDKSTEIKNPGLVMLTNIKSRKSEMLKENQLSNSQNEKESLVSEKLTPEKSQEKNKVSTKPAVKSNVVSATNTENQIDIERKVPGLRMTADIRRRKSELNLVANEEFVKPSISTNQSEIIHGFKQPINTEFKEKNKKNPEPENSLTSIDLPPSIVSLKRPSIHPPTPIPKPKNSRKSKFPPMVSDKVPGLSITESIKKRKSDLLVTENIKKTGEKETKEQVENVTETEIDSKFDSPVVTCVPINSLRRQSIHPSTPIPKLNIPRKSKLQLPMVSDKVPGLLTTSYLKKQKTENLSHKSATLDANFKHLLNPQTVSIDKSSIEQLDNHLPMLELQDIHKEKAATLDSSSSVKFLSLKDRKQPAGILSKPSPFKRPISALEASEDDAESKCKISRVQTENRRQSVTFNREVEVKEIHGNSFNSVTTDDCGSGDEGIDFEHRLKDELERVKNRVGEKHNQNLSFSHSNEFVKDRQRIIGPSAFNRYEAKKSSDLSGMISNRIKIQSNSPPRESHQIRSKDVTFTFDQSKSGALKKVAPCLQVQKKETAAAVNWKSFKQNPVSQQVIQSNDQLNDESVSMDTDEKEELNKSKCSIM